MLGTFDDQCLTHVRQAIEKKKKTAEAEEACVPNYVKGTYRVVVPGLNGPMRIRERWVNTYANSRGKPASVATFSNAFS